ncbi:uncharacterized protein LOC110449177 [Mizuhopecten yessoensis]|uniref:uncharacterized protein LOC110449177 n=1 Tax=Mizuhopecten yessoensis TaxID=6573 RepID=UPI000B458892|nr:uncharacterized protein LOC110449177 [Mizuhopecten yessoensis]
MENVRTKKRQWRPRRPDDQQPQGRKQIRLTRMDDTLKVVLTNDSCQRQVIHNHCCWSEPKPVTTSVPDRFHGSKPKCQEATTNKQSSKVQQYSDKSQTKAVMSQLAGFLKKRSFSDSTNTRTTVHTSDVIKKTSHTCDDKPVYNESRNSFCSPLKEISSVPDSVPCDIKHRTILGPATKPPW